jgi:hypothetical protein
VQVQAQEGLAVGRFSFRDDFGTDILDVPLRRFSRVSRLEMQVINFKALLPIEWVKMG